MWSQKRLGNGDRVAGYLVDDHQHSLPHELERHCSVVTPPSRTIRSVVPDNRTADANNDQMEPTLSLQSSALCCRPQPDAPARLVSIIGKVKSEDGRGKSDLGLSELEFIGEVEEAD
eukprot:1389650-Rhodomonas_salina.3